MKLDRNTNQDGTGKYALVQMRKLVPVLNSTDGDPKSQIIAEAFMMLLRDGYITLGDESPGDQFFVMKYKDRFTHSGLHAYAVAVSGEAQALRDLTLDRSNKESDELDEFAREIFVEARKAKELGVFIPD